MIPYFPILVSLSIVSEDEYILTYTEAGLLRTKKITSREAIEIKKTGVINEPDPYVKFSFMGVDMKVQRYEGRQSGVNLFIKKYNEDNPENPLIENGSRFKLKEAQFLRDGKRKELEYRGLKR
jgi:hypothetical protein